MHRYNEVERVHRETRVGGDTIYLMLSDKQSGSRAFVLTLEEAEKLAALVLAATHGTLTEYCTPKHGGGYERHQGQPKATVPTPWVRPPIASRRKRRPTRMQAATRGA